MKKYNFCLMNPPYGRNFEYLKFLDKSIQISDTLISIQPAKWLTLIRENGKKSIKQKCSNLLDKISDVEIQNYNKEFNTGLTDVFSIIKATTNDFETIHFKLFGEDKEVNSIDDINFFGTYKTIKSILDKVNAKSECKVSKLISNEKDDKSAYIRVSNKLTYHPDIEYTNNVDTFFDNKHKNNIGEDWQIVYRYIAAFRHKNDNEIIDSSKLNEDNTYIKVNFNDSFEKNKEILNNFEYFICHSKLGHILCMLLFQDENGHNYRNVFPFIIFDKEMTDDEYYKYFDLSKEEIQLIDKCHSQFERKSKTNYLYSYLYE